MCPSLIEIGSKTAEKNSAQTNRHYENNGHLAVNQQYSVVPITADLYLFKRNLEAERLVVIRV